jgi:aminoglycoside phosphotransferase (APT) family kinase protein
MANVNRRFLTDHQLAEILRSQGIDADLTGHEVLAGGTFNTVYRLSFADRPGLVLKLTPDPEGAAMTYEQGILRTEAEFYTLARSRAGLPVPQVIAVAELGAGNGQALLVEELPGVPWSQVTLPAVDQARLRAELGRLVASMRQVTGPGFGYPSESTGQLTARWADAFTGMMDALLADAARFEADLPVTAERVRKALAACTGDLDEVRVPTLVHFDLWSGNILVDVAGGPGGSPVISGIIDGERSLWGDPVIDLVSTALLAEIRDDADFLRGYQGSGAELPLDGSARRRLLLYRVYLGLIMTVEPIPRGSREARPSEFTRRIEDHLSADLAELERLTGLNT